MTFFAFTNRLGIIGFGHHVPVGQLIIVDDPDDTKLRAAVEVVARHAYDGATLLVPGIPEADSDIDALDALIAFRRQVARRLFPEMRP